MTREDILAKVKSLNLPENSFIVFGSGPLAALGIREVNDIDLLVSKELREQLKKAGWEEQYKGPDDTPIAWGDFEAHDNWNFSPYAPTFRELLSRATVIEGVPFASIEDVRKWKDASRRGNKDVTDIQLIDQYLEKTE